MSACEYFFWYKDGPGHKDSRQYICVFVLVCAQTYLCVFTYIHMSIYEDNMYSHIHAHLMSMPHTCIFYVCVLY